MQIVSDLPVLDVLVNLGCTVEPCGSRVTCNPPPSDTDADYLVHIPYDDDAIVGRVVNELARAHFSWEGNEHYQSAATSDFMSWRGDENVNLIVTANAAFAARHRVATALCKRLNLQDKNDRISLFQAVLYGNEWNGESWAEMKAKRMAFTVQPHEEIAF